MCHRVPFASGLCVVAKINAHLLTRRRGQSLLSGHGHGAIPGEECGRGRRRRRQLDGSGAGPASVRQRDALDPLPAGGVCGQCVGVLQRGDRTHIHVLFPAVHFTVSSVD